VETLEDDTGTDMETQGFSPEAAVAQALWYALDVLEVGNQLENSLGWGFEDSLGASH